MAEHVEQLRAASPPGSAHVLDLTSLAAPGVTLWVAHEVGRGPLVGSVALRDLGEGHGELKSMRTVTVRRRAGIGTALLNHVVAQARDRGMVRLSLETGAQEFFAPARALYAAHGFEVCAPFGDYRPDPASVFMTREL